MKLENIISKIIKSDPKTDWQVITKESLNIWYFKNDVNIRLETTYEGEDIQNPDFKADWVKIFPGKAKGIYFNLFYRSSRIEQFLLISIDSGTVYMPCYDVLNKSIEPIDYKIAQIMNKGNLELLEAFIEMSGLRSKYPLI